MLLEDGQRKKRSKSKVSSDPGSLGQTPLESEGRSELACLDFCCAAYVDAVIIVSTYVASINCVLQNF